MARGHDYKLARNGRRLTSRNGVGGQSHSAHLQCSRCPKEGKVALRMVMPPDHIDRKFTQIGWRPDARLCPDCVTAKSREKTMASKPSSGAVKATAKIFTLLTQHFDADNGRYVAEWDDARIARETGMAHDTVAEFRREAFGEIKEPTELALIRADLQSLEQLQREQASAFASDVASLRTRLADAGKKLGIVA